MTVFLAILKAIGIFLLILLAILAAALLIILFVPVRYRANGAYKDGFWAKVQVTWLFYLLHFQLSYEEKADYSLRIAGWQFFPKKEKKSAGKETAAAQCGHLSTDASETKQATQENKKAQGVPERTKMNVHSQADKIGRSKTVAGKQSEDTAKQSGTTAPKRSSCPGAAEPDTAQKSPTEKNPPFWQKWLSQLQRIYDTIKTIKTNVSRYLRILLQEENKRALRAAAGCIGKLLRSILPKKTEIYVVAGTGDPASTGDLLALQGILYPWLYDKLVLVPDFDNKHLEATFHLQGRIFLCAAVWRGLQVLCNRQFLHLIDLLLKKGEMED